MTEDGSEDATEGRAGPTHTGSGPQTNNYSFHAAPHRQRPDPLSIARERRRDLRRRFVRPPRFGEAAHRIAEPGAVVLLRGSPGTGRHAAATVLLHEAPDQVSGPQGRFEELTVARPDDTLDAGPRDRFLLNLSAVSSADYIEAQQSLALYRSAVEEAGARLAVVLPSGLDHLLDPQFEPLVVLLERPHGPAVVRRSLRLAGIPFEDEDLRTEALTRFFADDPMRELARFCATVDRARAGGRHGNAFRAWADEALGAVTHRAAEAAQQIKEVRSAEGRALLLSTAMLHGFPADTVFHSRSRLLRALGHRPEDDGTDAALFVRDDLLDELTRLRISRDARGLVTFDHLEYDAAIRRHFWLHFPDLRRTFGTWVEDVLAQGDVTDTDQQALTERFVERILDSGGPAEIFDLVRRWTDSDSPRPLHAPAATALEVALADERHVRKVLDQIRTWSREPTLPDGLLRALTDVCRDPMSATHPYHAVVRLHHLAHHPAGGSAREALFALVASDPRLLRYLHRRIAAYLGPRSPGNIALLLDLYEDAVLPADLPWPDLAKVWRAAMDFSDRHDWAPLVHRWLSAVLRIPEERREAALGVLVDAVAGSDRHGNQLYTSTCHWAAGRPERTATATWLRHGIDVAQGLVPDEAVPSPESEGVR
ncbi:hypothetical protein [Streptomyces sp. RerS4]|uniref:hypothetical protein n=1 Tax=Streptomyces sp. RerS4 TaxID=2942449 RepID=UPI00201C402A|nr:hypothetical protein [Streptomyces sp. RerS4]UQX02995.1 hypothetical protein M4D82_22730 [Streptomyces sp. RerS4]